MDLVAYLTGAFYHRFNRALRKERRRQQAVELVLVSQDLEQFRGALDADAEQGLDRIVQVTEVIENMDDWTREIWTARHYGYSWREIAEHKGLSEQQAKLDFNTRFAGFAIASEITLDVSTNSFLAVVRSKSGHSPAGGPEKVAGTLPTGVE